MEMLPKGPFPVLLPPPTLSSSVGGPGRRKLQPPACSGGVDPSPAPPRDPSFSVYTVFLEQLVLIQRNLLTHCLLSSLWAEVFLALFVEKKKAEPKPHICPPHCETTSPPLHPPHRTEMSLYGFLLLKNKIQLSKFNDLTGCIQRFNELGSSPSDP